MIYSMTGYGKATGLIGTRRYTIEVRSLNGKQLDLSVRIPSAFRAKEMELRKIVGESVARGKCDVTLQFAVEGIERRELNVPLIGAYIKDLGGIAEANGMHAQDESILGMALRLPDVVQQPREEVDESEWESIISLTREALQHFQDFRKNEGQAIGEDFQLRVSNIRKLEMEILPLLESRIGRIRERIQTNFEEIQNRDRLDENRFEQEVLFYIEKLDVSEELVRLKAHCDHFLDVMSQPQGQGKKLGFIAQEMGREINTLGSKANDAEIQRLVVQMKDELEKIKEQVLNAL